MLGAPLHKNQDNAAPAIDCLPATINHDEKRDQSAVLYNRIFNPGYKMTEIIDVKDDIALVPFVAR